MRQFKEYLNKKSDDLGQELMIYASGSGALSYVWQYRSGPDKGNASGEKVTELDAVALFATKEDGHYLSLYLLVELYGDYQIIQNMTQTSPNDEYETLHSSTKSAIRYFCENSKDWKVVTILDKLEQLK